MPSGRMRKGGRAMRVFTPVPLAFLDLLCLGLSVLPSLACSFFLLARAGHSVGITRLQKIDADSGESFEIIDALASQSYQKSDR